MSLEGCDSLHLIEVLSCRSLGDSQLIFLRDTAESLSKELESIGIKTLTVERGAFRTELLNQAPSTRAVSKLDDYSEFRRVQWKPAR